MKFAFQKMQLEADGFYKLINTWAETQLVVTEESATIIGYGYTYEIAGAFTMLVFDWEASIPLSRENLEIQEGSYRKVRMTCSGMIRPSMPAKTNKPTPCPTARWR